MEHEELKRRIRNMKQGGFLRMGPSNFAILTDNFCEELVKYILIQGETNERQSELIKVIKDKYGEWRKDIGDITWDSPYTGKNYPKYMDELDFKIACGDIIEEDSGMIGSWDKVELISAPKPEFFDIEKEKLQARIEEKEEENEKLQHQLEESQKRIKEQETEKEALKQILEQKEFRSTKPEDAILKEEIERQKQKREDMLVELVRPSFLVEADARRFVKEIDNGMDSDGVAEVARRYYLGNKIVKSKRGRSLWEILHAAKLYDKVEQSWTREMRKAD